MNCIELQCDKAFQYRTRGRATDTGPRIFIGRVSSSDSVKRNGLTRDRATATERILAFEMEAAGVCTILPTLVVKGVCDYADSHKNKIWQAYASVTAAACAKVLLEEWISYATTTVTEDPSSAFEEKKITPEDRKKCLASLDFAQLDYRLTSISFPHSHTCEWISRTTEFRAWLDGDQVGSHNRVLWLKGKPGCGKSTMMKHLYHTSSQYLPRNILLSYFFHARGSALERTPTGMLRTLLYQLLSAKSGLLDMLIREYPKQTLSNMESHQWTFEELEGFFMLCARQGHLDNVTILVDALDECESNEASKIANFCEDLSINAVARQTSCFICISIRHFPSIGMKTCVRLNLDEKSEHRADIQSYVEAKLHVEDAQDLTAQIIQKSNHVFLWAVLVVKSLNSAHDEGADTETLQELLSNIPNELHAIFETLLGPQELMVLETKLALQIVLYAFKPLRMRELRFLILAGLRSNSARSGTFWKTTPSMLHKYFITKSHGLLELIRKSSSAELDGDEVVQFIHESMRDYLLSDRHVDGSMLHDGSACHEAIARACLEGMKLINENPELAAGLEESHLRVHFGGDHMLRWVLHHIGSIQTHELTIDLLHWYSKVLRIKRELLWMPEDQGSEQGLLSSIIECYRHDHRLGIDLERIGQLARLLRLVLTDGSAMFVTLSELGTRTSDYALRRATYARWPQGVDAALHAGANPALRDSQGETILHYSMQCLFFAVADTQPEQITYRIIQELQERGHNFDDPSIQRPLPLAFACQYGSARLVIALLEAGASLTQIDPKLGAPLDIAVILDRRNIAQILLEYGADPIVRHGLDCSPTEYALRTSSLKMARILSAYRSYRKPADQESNRPLFGK